MEDEDATLPDEFVGMTVTIYLVKNDEGEWALSIVEDADRMMVPLVAINEDTHAMCRRLASHVAASTGTEFRVVEFVALQEIPLEEWLTKFRERSYTIQVPGGYEH